MFFLFEFIFRRKIVIIPIFVILLQINASAFGQVEEDELVTEYTIIGHSTSISSTVGSTSSTNSGENVSVNEDAETEARSSADSTGAGSNIVSSSLPTDSTVANDNSLASEGGTSAFGSSSTRQYIAVTQTPVITKRKGVLKAETADVQVNWDWECGGGGGGGAIDWKYVENGIPMMFSI